MHTHTHTRTHIHTRTDTLAVDTVTPTHRHRQRRRRVGVLIDVRHAAHCPQRVLSEAPFPAQVALGVLEKLVGLVYGVYLLFVRHASKLDGGTSGAQLGESCFLVSCC